MGSSSCRTPTGVVTGHHLANWCWLSSSACDASSGRESGQVVYGSSWNVAWTPAETTGSCGLAADRHPTNTSRSASSPLPAQRRPPLPLAGHPECPGQRGCSLTWVCAASWPGKGCQWGRRSQPALSCNFECKPPAASAGPPPYLARSRCRRSRPALLSVCVQRAGAACSRGHSVSCTLVDKHLQISALVTHQPEPGPTRAVACSNGLLWNVQFVCIYEAPGGIKQPPPHTCTRSVRQQRVFAA